MKRILKKLDKIWNERQSFTFLLIVLAFYMFVVIPFLNDRILGKLLFVAFYFLFLSSGLHFLGKKKEITIVLIFIISPLIILVSQLFLDSPWLSLATDLFVIIYCIWLGSILLKRTFSQGHITVSRVQGAVIVYLLSGFAFALLYHGIYLIVGPSAYNGLDFFPANGIYVF